MIIRVTSSIVCFFLLASTLAAQAGPTVHVIIGKEAPPLERLAADELVGQFKQLFDSDVVITNAVPGDAKNVVLIGSPKTNPAVKTAAGDNWSQLSDQGIVLKSVADSTTPQLIVGGGSPVATLWAVYELGHRHGIRYLLREDIFPDDAELKLTGVDVVMEPTLRTRTWRTVNDFAIGPESWGLADHQRLLRQLAKMKFNRVMISVYPWQPFVHFDFGGVAKQTGVLWYGETYRVDGDTPGKTAFGGAETFQNQDFVGAETYEQRIAAGTKLLRGIIEQSHRLGMTAGLSISPLEFPREFAAALPGAELARGLRNMTIRPAAKNTPDDPVLQRIARTQIEAYLKTYPNLDALYLTLPEFPDWTEHVDDAWKRLNERHDLGDVTLDALVAAAANRQLVASGNRGANALKGNIVGLAFLNGLIEEITPLAGDRSLQLVITQVDPELYPILDRILPKNAATLNFIDYTARRIVQNRDTLSKVPAGRIPSSLILTLADDNVGVLSQSATRNIDELVGDLRKHGWDGFSTRYWMLAELDQTVHYLSRASFDENVTARSAHDDLFATICSNTAVSDRLWLGFSHIEAATNLIDENDLGFAFPVQGMLMKHYRAEPIPPWWEEMTEQYTQAMIELYRSHDGTHPRARKTLFYYAKRSEYVLEYLGCVKALREAAIAQQEGDTDAAIEKFEVAIESLYNAMDTLADVVRDPSDRGLIAVLATHAYQPLLAEYEKLVAASEAN